LHKLRELQADIISISHREKQLADEQNSFLDKNSAHQPVAFLASPAAPPPKPVEIALCHKHLPAGCKKLDV